MCPIPYTLAQQHMHQRTIKSSGVFVIYLPINSLIFFTSRQSCYRITLCIQCIITAYRRSAEAHIELDFFPENGSGKIPRRINYIKNSL
jgi:hypothetical protein